MRYLYFTLLPTILTFHCFSQQNHFIYLQTENKQPFFVKVNNKVYSSTLSGYAILSKLTDGDYKLIIGFPKNVMPEQSFNCTIDKRDLGFLVKNFGEKGWGLYNLQSQDVTMAGDVLIKKNSTSKKKSDDPFSNMLANVVHDSTINQKDEVAEEPKKVEAENSKSVAPEVLVVQTNSTMNKEAGASIITRTFKKKNKDGLEFIYVDQFENRQDTIHVFMPVEKPEKKKLVDTIKVTAIKPELQPLQKEQEVLPKQTQIDTTVETTSIKPESKKKEEVMMINSDCKFVASDDDFRKLRKKMAAENNEDDMLTVAKKTFKSKCFTTEQVKNLSPLFLKDGGKYAFFEIAYPFVSDSGFDSLESQLTDPYYLNRFRAMVHK